MWARTVLGKGVHADMCHLASTRPKDEVFRAFGDMFAGQNALPKSVNRTKFPSDREKISHGFSPERDTLSQLYVPYREEECRSLSHDCPK